MMMTSGESVCPNRKHAISLPTLTFLFYQVRYKSFIDAGKQIVAKEGVKSLFGMWLGSLCGTIA
jgi:hypothetical protein